MASKVNIVVDQGTSFSTAVTVNGADDEPVDFTGYTGTSQMRKSYTSSTYYTFDVDFDAYGSVFLSMSANNTSAVPAGRYLYDVEVTNPSGVVSRIIEGIVTVTPQVTR